jgi:hypothetical protein
VNQLARGRELGSKPNLTSWERLSEATREDNRRQVDHNFVKLRDADWAAVPTEDPSDVWLEATRRRWAEHLHSTVSGGATLARRMAEAEHRRWNASLFMDGWKLGPRDDVRKIHDNLVDFDALTPDVQGYDLDAVLALPEVMAVDGLRIVPKVRFRIQVPADARLEGPGAEEEVRHLIDLGQTKANQRDAYPVFVLSVDDPASRRLGRRMAMVAEDRAAAGGDPGPTFEIEAFTELSQGGRNAGLSRFASTLWLLDEPGGKEKLLDGVVPIRWSGL